MRRKINKDVVTLFGNIQKVILAKPAINQMFDDVQMMKFKIRPIQGDLMSFDLKNKQFIESLWSLGKLDEFFYREVPTLSKKEKEVFMKLFDSLYFKYQQQLNQTNLQQRKVTLTRTGLLELEIYKERKLKQKVN
ncbi:conserved hypothetical protein [Candidatus Roizmanbacteria bacterium]|mgnify:FL=1|nr:conserved hypothetical protein [Candidatus Roizmanbacteria bacterium]